MYPITKALRQLWMRQTQKRTLSILCYILSPSFSFSLSLFFVLSCLSSLEMKYFIPNKVTPLQQRRINFLFPRYKEWMCQKLIPTRYLTQEGTNKVLCIEQEMWRHPTPHATLHLFQYMKCVRVSIYFSLCCAIKHNMSFLVSSTTFFLLYNTYHFHFV